MSELAEVIKRVRRHLDPDGDFFSQYVATQDALALCTAASRVEQLEANLDESQAREADWHRVADSRSAEIGRLEAELAQAKADAERLGELSNRRRRVQEAIDEYNAAAIDYGKHWELEGPLLVQWDSGDGNCDLAPVSRHTLSLKEWKP